MCFLSTTFPNAPAHPSPPILFDQSLNGRFHHLGTYFSSSAKPCSHQLNGDPFHFHECSGILAVTNGRLSDDYRIQAPVQKL